MSKLILLSGLPGAGKSTFSKRYFDIKDTWVLSSDDIRVELFGFRDQTRNEELWSNIFNRAIKLSKNYNVVIDALNISVKDRRRTLNKIGKYFDSVEIYQFLTPLKVILETNNKRKGTEEYIPEDILKRKIASLEIPLLSEGFDKIYFISRNEPAPQWALSNYYNFDQDNPHHNETLGVHTKRVYDYVVRKNVELEKVARYHDCGKVYTKVFNEEKGYSQFIGHANASVYWYLNDEIRPYLYKGEYSQWFKGTYIINGSKLYKEKIMRDALLIKYHDLSFSKPSREDLIEYFKNKKILPCEEQSFVDDLLLLHEGDKLRVSDDEAKEEMLKSKLCDIKNELISKGYNIIYVGLYGSQNYNLEDKNSDIDIKAIVSLDLEEIIERKTISKTVKHKYGDADIKDILTYEGIISKGNCQYVEALQTKYWVGDKRIRNILSKQKQNKWAVYGFITEKAKALTHEYPSKAEEFKNFGCDPKQYHHILRLYKIFKEDIPYFYTYEGKEREEMIKFKRGMNGETLEEKIKNVERIKSEVKEELVNSDYKYEPVNLHNEIIQYIYDTIREEIAEEVSNDNL